jgi:hypothetical protein
MESHHVERSIGELFSDLSQQTGELVRQEMRLAKAELGEKLSGLGAHAMKIGVAAAFGLAAVMAIAAAVTLLLVEIGLEPWLAALITAAAFGLTGFVLVQSAMTALRKTSITPVETIHTLKETTQWVKNATR